MPSPTNDSTCSPEYLRAFALSREEGLQEGRQENIQQVAHNLKAGGITLALVAQTTGLTEAEIAAL